MSHRLNILVMSPSAEELQPAMQSLTAEGATIRQAEGGYRLVAQFSAAPADVVVLDMSGLRQ